MFSIDCAGLAWGAVVVLRARVAGLIRLLTFRSRGSLSLSCLVRFGLLSFAPLFAGGSRTRPVLIRILALTVSAQTGPKLAVDVTTVF